MQVELQLEILDAGMKFALVVLALPDRGLFEAAATHLRHFQKLRDDAVRGESPMPIHRDLKELARIREDFKAMVPEDRRTDLP